MTNKLYVSSIPYSSTDETLQAHFEQIGPVTSAKIIMDRETGRSRGFGFVEMESAELAQQAIEELNEKEFDGRTIYIQEARERQ